MPELNVNQCMKHKFSLDGYFNSNAFNSSKWKNDDFDGNGYYYEIGVSAMQSGRIYDILDINLSKEMDHIRCMNQVFEVGIKGRYKREGWYA